MITGIYCIKNKLNKEEYIGSSYNIQKRFMAHKRALKDNKHHSIYLQRAWNKYGEENFIFEVLLECLQIELLEKEQYFFENRDCNYNVSKDAIAPMKGRKHNKETKKLLSKLHKGNKYCLGKKWTESQRRNILNKKIGSKRNNKTKLKMSETAKRINSISRIDREKQRKKIIDSNGVIYQSLSEAAKITGISVQAICDNLKNRSKRTRKGKLIFKYV